MVRNAPRAFFTGTGRKLFGWRPLRPWISYDATRVIGARLGQHMRVLEFGSGTSTIWFAERCAEIVSIESDPDWFHRVAAMLAGRRLDNVRLRLATDPACYATLAPADIDDGFDLVLIDGEVRHRCVVAALSLLRPGGAIYLDNADRGQPRRLGEAEPAVLTGHTPMARRILLAFADAVGARTEWFTDFAPTQFFVGTGLLVTLPNDRAPPANTVPGAPLPAFSAQPEDEFAYMGQVLAALTGAERPTAPCA